MYQLRRHFFILFFICICTFWAGAQYTLKGSARQDNCNCYTLTPEESMKSGSVLNNTPLDLNKSFDFSFNVFLGCKDVDGADGMAFVLQTEIAKVGRRGSGMGIADISPSIAIALDTYQNIDPTVSDDNLNDPPYDHISIHINGVVRHGNDLDKTVRASASSDNIEDCQWHILRIKWVPSTKMLSAYFDGSLRVETSIDLVKDIFGNNSKVYWGFSSATGSRNNLQKFCTALKADFTTNFPENGTCVGNAISFTNSTVSFAPDASYFWDLGDGTTSTSKDVPSHLYTQPGNYTVKLAVTGQDGCSSDTVSQVITIASKPHAQFTVFDTCQGTAPRLVFLSDTVGATTQWLFNGNVLSTGDDQQPVLANLAAGKYALKAHIVSKFGCGTSEATEIFTIKSVPVVSAVVHDLCLNDQKLPFRAVQEDGAATITQWNWQLGNGQEANLQNPIPAYRSSGSYATRLWATASNGCTSDTITRMVTVHPAAVAFAGRDTTVTRNMPFQLKGSGEGRAVWTPAEGLSRNDVFNPTALLSDDQSYELTVTTAEGCVAKDTVNIKILRKTAIYVPTAFTPDGDGLNDRLKPTYNGIKKLVYFSVYNRWGEVVFQTSEMGTGWDGRHKGRELPAGTYVWILKAEDITGYTHQLKGSITLIR